MFRLWAKIYKDNKMVSDMLVENGDRSLNRTRKVFDAVDKICYEFNLSQPIWLESSIREFKRYDKVRFNQNNFIDSIEFDYLELQVIEEDDTY